MQRDEFLVDVGVYPGSSGSLIFLLDEVFYKKSRELEEGPDKSRLLGIISSGYDFTAEGIVTESDPETRKAVVQAGQVAMSNIPMDLGIAIKSTKLLDFKPILKKALTEQGTEVQDD